MSINSNRSSSLYQMLAAALLLSQCSLMIGCNARGVYKLDVMAAITGGDIFTITGDATNKFYVLRGDWNGTGGVNIQDFSTYAYWFGQGVPRAPAYVDLNGSGGINIQDFSGFAANFGKSLTFPDQPAERIAGAGVESEEVPVVRTLVNPSDVNGDGSVTVHDALNVVNQLLGDSSMEHAWSRYDANQDGEVSASDALYVINRLVTEPTISPRVSSMEGENKLNSDVDRLMSDDDFVRDLF